MEIQPYLFFEGRCEEALEFYKKAVDAEIEMMMRYEESPAPHEPGRLPPGSEKNIMHCAFRVGGALVLASDGMCSGTPKFGSFGLALTVPDVATIDRFFGALAADGEVQMPLGETFWSDRFGMVTDRFGILWMIGLPQKES